MEHVEDRLRAYLDKEAAGVPLRDDLLIRAQDAGRRQRRQHRTLVGGLIAAAAVAATGTTLAATDNPWHHGGTTTAAASGPSAIRTPLPTSTLMLGQTVPRPPCSPRAAGVADFRDDVPGDPAAPATQALRWRDEHLPTVTELHVYLFGDQYQYVTLSAPDGEIRAVLGFSPARLGGWNLDSWDECHTAAATPLPSTPGP